MPSSGFFDTVFGVDGTLTTVPDAVQSDGSVSYTQGFGIDYTLPSSNPSYKYMPQGQFNQLFYDITYAIQAIQQTGVPPYFSYISSNGGYAKYARVLYTDGHVYQSLLASNTVTPTNDGVNWTLFDASAQRIKLTANANYYVATTGSDSNSGTSGSPWLTIQHAVNYVLDTIDAAGFTVTINVADGTYTSGFSVSSPMTGGGTLQFTGDTTTPSNCIISVTSANCVTVSNNAVISLGGFKLAAATSGIGILATSQGIVNINGAMNYGTVVGTHIDADEHGTILINANYTISGNANVHWETARGGVIVADSLTITLSGIPAFNAEFALSYLLGFMDIESNTFTGSATGTRYTVASNGVIDTAGAGSTYLPGNASGSTATGGQYI